MCTPCVHHEELLSLDVTSNPIFLSRLFPILLDLKSFQTALDSSRPMSMWLPGHVPISYLSSHCRLIIIILNPNPSSSLSILSYYNRKDIIVVFIKFCIKRINYSNLENRILITRNLKYNCSLIVSKNRY